MTAKVGVDTSLRESVRMAMRRWVWPVTILAVEVDGTARGITISSVTSLSLDPPSAVLCVERRSRMHADLRVDGRYGLSVLADSQVAIGERLSIRGSDKSIPADELDPDPAFPVIRGAVAAFGIEIRQLVPADSHSVVIAAIVKVLGGDPDPSRLPLAYHDRRFVSIRERDLSLPSR